LKDDYLSNNYSGSRELIKKLENDNNLLKQDNNNLREMTKYLDEKNTCLSEKIERL